MISRPTVACMDMGARRRHSAPPISAARAASWWLQGTSDSKLAKRYRIRCISTAAHAFTLLHDTERITSIQVAKLGAG